jgi:hypothetical protein
VVAGFVPEVLANIVRVCLVSLMFLTQSPYRQLVMISMIYYLRQGVGPFER